MKKLGILLQIDIVHTTTYNPQSNVFVERMNSTLLGVWASPDK